MKIGIDIMLNGDKSVALQDKSTFGEKVNKSLFVANSSLSVMFPVYSDQVVHVFISNNHFIRHFGPEEKMQLFYFLLFALFLLIQ